MVADSKRLVASSLSKFPFGLLVPKGAVKYDIRLLLAHYRLLSHFKTDACFPIHQSTSFVRKLGLSTLMYNSISLSYHV